MRINQKASIYQMRLVAAALLSALLSGCAGAQRATPYSEADAAREGRALANDLCAGCHAVGATGESTDPAAPPFRQIAAAYDTARLERDLQSGVLMGHPALPSVRLSPAGARDLAAYLKAVRSSGAR